MVTLMVLALVGLGDFWGCDVFTPGIGGDAVYREIKVSPEVRRKIEKLLAERRDAEHARVAEVRRAAEAAGQESPWFIPADAELKRQTTRRIAALLTREQRDRLNEMVVQDLGTRALLEPPVAKVLGLAPDTVELIRQMIAEADDRQWANHLARTNAREVPTPGGPALPSLSAEESRRQTAEDERFDRLARRPVDAEILKLLTRKQRAKFAAMAGTKPFDWKAARRAEAAAGR
jgi:hypothetical protein